jgi:hypothetical protein
MSMDLVEIISPAARPESAAAGAGSSEKSQGFDRMLQRAIKGETERTRPDSGQTDSREQRRSAGSDSEPVVQGPVASDHGDDGQEENANNLDNAGTVAEESPLQEQFQEQITIILGEQYETTIPLETITAPVTDSAPTTGTGEPSVTVPALPAVPLVTGSEGVGIAVDSTTVGETIGVIQSDLTGALNLNASLEGAPVRKPDGDRIASAGTVSTTIGSPEGEIAALTGDNPEAGEAVDLKMTSAAVSGGDLKPDPLQNQNATLESERQLTGTSQVPVENPELTGGIAPSLTAGPRNTLTAETKFQLDGRPVIETGDGGDTPALELDQSNKRPRHGLTSPGPNTREPVPTVGKEESVQPISGGTFAEGESHQDEIAAKVGTGSRLTGSEPVPATGREQMALNVGGLMNSGQPGMTPLSGEQVALDPLPEISLDRLPRETVRIVETMTRSGERIFETTMRLNPPELGQMRLEVKLENDRLSARFIVDNAVARQHLEMEIPRLRAVLESQGLEEAQIEVQIELGDADNWREQQENGSGDESGWGEDGNEQDWQGLAGQGEASSHDGLIDLRA